MKRDLDFFYVATEHLAIHERLCNWSRYVEVRRGNAPSHPMWAKSRSNARQWHAPLIRDHTDTLDGHVMEKAVAALPAKHRDALRWCYCYKYSPARARRELGVTYDGLMELVRQGRAMLVNRRA